MKTLTIAGFPLFEIMSGSGDRAYVSGTQHGTAKQYRLLISNYQRIECLQF